MSTGYTANRPPAPDSGAGQQVQNIVYYKADGSPETKWVDSEAEKVARQLVVKRPDGRGLDEVRSIKSSQLRKFYADIKNSERIWEYGNQTEEVFQRILPQIKILKAKAAYAKGRRVVPQSFTAWVSAHVNAIKKPEDFKAFLLHFEAVVGFCYGEGLKD